MQKQYAAEGLVCLSVNIDEEKEEQANALKFLQKQNVTFPNFLLDEPEKVWKDKWNVKGVPLTFIFDRDGIRARKFTDGGEEIEKDLDNLVLELLRRKK
jgi:hypothetical protein